MYMLIYVCMYLDRLTSELARDWSVIDHIGHLSVMQMCGPPLTSVPHVGTHTSVDRKCAHTHARTHTRTHAHTHTHTRTHRRVGGAAAPGGADGHRLAQVGARQGQTHQLPPARPAQRHALFRGGFREAWPQEQGPGPGAGGAGVDAYV